MWRKSIISINLIFVIMKNIENNSVITLSAGCLFKYNTLCKLLCIQVPTGKGDDSYFKTDINCKFNSVEEAEKFVSMVCQITNFIYEKIFPFESKEHKAVPDEKKLFHYWEIK